MTLTRLRLLALAAFLVLPCAARAQLSVYADAALTGYGYNSNATLGLKTVTGGLIVGGFYNFPIQSRLTAGVDLRTGYSPGNNGGNFTLAAFRIGFVPRSVRLRPYFQIGGGVVSTTGTSYTSTSLPTGGFVVNPSNQRYTNGAVEIDFGLDIRLTDHFDLRALDYGAAAGASSSTAIGAGFIGSGVVYHLGSGGH